MNDELISKKDLLELTGISYGQLYRWKRKNLIPEEWFVRKSTFTGQETFFPREQMLSRIKKIQNMKDDLSLDDIADLLSPDQTSFSISKEEILKQEIVSKYSLVQYAAIFPEREELSFYELIYLHVLDSLLVSGDIHVDEGRMAIEFLREHTQLIKQGKSRLILLRKMGVSSCLLLTNTESVYADKKTNIVFDAALDSLAEALKIKIQGK
ncbi:DNA-binding transcriptional MerR regulator [Peribacillus deserti]|uniref:DNA-binding transcriptional MerR regulator n=1 Tax=Peribacillus deserti TaxID=673318 RepID=A0ABS2QJX6_9BACI|nr:YhbD family protein [Peribacillus deserti]MBM7693402.1 DNA-binding transcriptional MerR regulator [Peribacillus deserti]